MKTIVINGISYPLTWTSVSNWTANIALGPGANSLALAGYDLRGAPVTNGADSITITYTSSASDNISGKAQRFYRIEQIN